MGNANRGFMSKAPGRMSPDSGTLFVRLRERAMVAVVTLGLRSLPGAVVSRGRQMIHGRAPIRHRAKRTAPVAVNVAGVLGATSCQRRASVSRLPTGRTRVRRRLVLPCAAAIEIRGRVTREEALGACDWPRAQSLRLTWTMRRRSWAPSVVATTAALTPLATA